MGGPACKIVFRHARYNIDGLIETNQHGLRVHNFSTARRFASIFSASSALSILFSAAIISGLPPPGGDHSRCVALAFCANISSLKVQYLR